MSTSSAEVAEAIAAAQRLAHNDLLFYVQSSFKGYQTAECHRRICSELMEFERAVRNKESPRLIIELPPRAGKSLICAERFPTWVLGRDPAARVITTSYGYDLAATFTTHSRDLYKSDFHKGVFPQSAISQSIAKNNDWETIKGGGMLGAGVGGPITGKGAQYLIIDDPVKNWEEALSKKNRDSTWDWFATTAYTRLAPGGGVLIIMTRWHPDDLGGRAIASGDYRVVKYPAITESGESYDPVRWPIEELEKTKKTIGTTKFSCLYQQDPSSAEGQIFKRKFFRHHLENPTKLKRMCISVDAAFKDASTSDKVAIHAWGEVNRSYYLYTRDTRRMGFAESVSAIKKMYAEFSGLNPTILIEEKANGSAIIETLKSTFSRIIAINPEGGKVARAFACDTLFEAGRVSFNAASPWIEEFENTLADFPAVENDDDVDAMTQALNYLEFNGNIPSVQYGHLNY